MSLLEGGKNVKCSCQCVLAIDLWTPCIVSEGWAGSIENSMKLHSIDGLTQVGYAKQRPTVLVGAVCDYLDLLVNPVSFFLFPFSSYVKLSEIC